MTVKPISRPATTAIATAIRIFFFTLLFLYPPAGVSLWPDIFLQQKNRIPNGGDHQGESIRWRALRCIRNGQAGSSAVRKLILSQQNRITRPNHLVEKYASGRAFGEFQNPDLDSYRMITGRPVNAPRNRCEAACG